MFSQVRRCKAERFTHSPILDLQTACSSSGHREWQPRPHWLNLRYSCTWAISEYGARPPQEGLLPDVGASHPPNTKATYLFLEAQQRYFSYRAILVAIVSRNSFVLVCVGYRTIIVRYVANWGIAQVCLCETKCSGGVSHHFGGVLTSDPLKSNAKWGIAAIVSQYRAIWGH